MNERQIRAKYNGKCVHCSGGIKAGDLVMYDVEAKAVWHLECHADRTSTQGSPVKPVQEGVTARYNRVCQFCQKAVGFDVQPVRGRYTCGNCVGALVDELRTPTRACGRCKHEFETTTGAINCDLCEEYYEALGLLKRVGIGQVTQTQLVRLLDKIFGSSEWRA